MEDREGQAEQDDDDLEMGENDDKLSWLVVMMTMITDLDLPEESRADCNATGLHPQIAVNPSRYIWLEFFLECALFLLMGD